MGDTVEAIGYKTDVKARAKESVQEKKDSVQQKVSGVRERITGAKNTVSDKTPGTGDVKQGARQAAGVAQQNPLGLGIAAIAGGFLAGMLIPSTRVEDEKFGETATEVKDRVKDTAQEAMEHGKQVAQEVAQNATETAKEQGQQHADELKSSMQS